MLDILSYLIIGFTPLLLIAFWLGKKQAVHDKNIRFNSQPEYYGYYTSLMMLWPVILITVISSIIQKINLFSLPNSMVIVALVLASGLSLWLSLRNVQPHFRARQWIESKIYYLLIAAALISILTTLGIVLAIVFEAVRFFELVSFWDFLTGTQWNPDAAHGTDIGGLFGSVPIFAGTFMITAIALAVAIPIGLLSAIYMSEYASTRIRDIAKPMLEVLAGIPTVVYGFFAAITVSPLVVDFALSLGMHADYTNALAPGIVMGIMIIPFVSSLSDDVIRAVPQSMRDGSAALGMTHSETIVHIVLPAALPGIVAAFLLALSRAIGETMIVVMAAGLRPNLSWNPLEGMTTVTVRIVDALTGDQAFDSPETLSAFGLGLVLLSVTLTLNVLSIAIVRRFREKYA
ncbi:MAG: phosphate ABC transporter permease subunit PstC [Mariprofundaceae bacterium]|nr:phosphate ABC transporter permease subunit PstC [Mariprofundaceae bacterium]